MTEIEFTNYVVNQGDCISSIAAQAGLLWQTIWGHPQNAELRSLRRDPNILHPGDVVAVPKLRLKQFSAQTEKKHKFVVTGATTMLRLRLLTNGKPRANLEYVLVIDGDSRRDFTDSDGRLEQPIPPKARCGELRLIDANGYAEIYTLQLGHLNPASELSGVQQRLTNLGFHCALIGEWDEQTRSAIAEFRRKNNLPGDEPLDERTRLLIKQKHGS